MRKQKNGLIVINIFTPNVTLNIKRPIFISGNGEKHCCKCVQNDYKNVLSPRFRICSLELIHLGGHILLL